MLRHPKEKAVPRRPSDIDPRSLARLAGEIERRAAALAMPRMLVAIAGPPGVGKSTFSEALREHLNELEPARCEILAMDGFHYDDLVLEEWGERARKGAPHTFDVDGLLALLVRIKVAVGDVAVPVFDRHLEIARAGARIVGPRATIILVEGNYLLLDDPRWTPLRDLFDLTIMLDAPFEDVEERLRRRWRGLTPAQRLAKMDGNDLPNARLVLDRSVAPDILVSNAGLHPAREDRA
jgi:pantothenate kinase